MKFSRDVYVNKAHSMLLEVTATTGTVGLIVYLIVICQLLIILKKLIKKDAAWGKTLFMVTILYLFHSQTNVISIGEEIFFWLILGITASS